MGDKDEDGYLIQNSIFKKNRKENGQYHSNWLNMMMPRLYLAKNLLREDGVIFISIDDNEVQNLRLLMNEIFGEENFITTFVWNTSGHTDNQFDIKITHEYILLYASNTTNMKLSYVVDPNTREKSNLWKGFAENSITKNGPGNPPSEINLPIGFPCKEQNINLLKNKPNQLYFDEVNKIGYISRDITKKFNMNYPVRYSDIYVKNAKTTNECRIFSGWANAKKIKAFIDNGCQPIEDNGDRISFYLSNKGVVYYYKERSKARHILSLLQNMGTTEKMRSELERNQISFMYPKPKELIKYLVKIGAGLNDIILDFFAGSGTTAHAVMQLNAEDGGHRKCISIQLPEICDEKSEAFKAGYKTIADIAKERIRRAGKKIKEDNKDKENIDQLDIGFKVLKVSDSNFREWRTDISSEKLDEQLDLHVDPIAEDASTENMVYELMLKNGKDLNSHIKHHNHIYSISDQENHDENILVLLLEKVNEDVIENVLQENPNKVIALDKLFKNNDQLKTNTALQMQDADIKFETI